MPIDIEPETINVDTSRIWSPVQWELTEEEHIQELDTQAQPVYCSPWTCRSAARSCNEYAIERLPPPPALTRTARGWNDELLTFQFKRPSSWSAQRSVLLSIVYDFKEFGNGPSKST